MAGVVAVVLTLASPWYGWHRDELYFASLPPAWGYVDQPPLVPLVAHALSASVALVRVPATLCAAASVVVVALIVRELGGDRPGDSSGMQLPQGERRPDLRSHRPRRGFARSAGRGHESRHWLRLVQR